MKKGVCLLCALVLALLCACGAEKEDETGPEETGTLRITENGGLVAEITLEEIAALPSYKRTMTIHSSGEGDSVHAYRGARLFEVLKAAGIDLDRYDAISAIGSDEYLASIAMEEVRMENNAFVMYEDNDQPIARKNGEAGGMRLVLLDDTFGTRFTKYLCEIELLREEE